MKQGSVCSLVDVAIAQAAASESHFDVAWVGRIHSSSEKRGMRRAWITEIARLTHVILRPYGSKRGRTVSTSVLSAPTSAFASAKYASSTTKVINWVSWPPLKRSKSPAKETW